MKILVVDDERAVRESLRRALELEGYDVELASDGREAVDRLDEVEPDAVILDVLMPGLDGLEVCRQLRSAGNRLPILMLTARDAVQNRVEGLDAGLRERAAVIAHIPAEAILQRFGPPPEAPFGEASGYPQLVSANGRTLRPTGASVSGSRRAASRRRSRDSEPLC